MKRFLSLNINKSGSLILSGYLKDYNISKDGDNSVDNNEKNCDFITFRFLNLNGI